MLLDAGITERNGTSPLPLMAGHQGTGDSLGGWEDTPERKSHLVEATSAKQEEHLGRMEQHAPKLVKWLKEHASLSCRSLRKARGLGRAGRWEAGRLADLTGEAWAFSHA